MVERDHPVLLPQLVRAAVGLEHPADSASEYLVRALTFGFPQHVGEGGQHLLLDLAVAFVEPGERLLGPVVRPPHPPEVHLGQVVAGGDLGVVDEADEQRTSVGVIRQSFHVADFERSRLGGELADLGVGHALDERSGFQQPHQLAEVPDTLADTLQGRWTRRRLEPGEPGEVPARLDVEEAVEPCPVVGREPTGDARVDLAVDPLACAPCQPVERAEGRKLDPFADECLDGNVDEVGRVAHHGRCFAHRLGRDGAPSFGVRADTEEAVDGSAVPMPVLPGGSTERGVRRETEHGGQVAAHALRHTPHRRQASQALVALQENEERELSLVCAGVGLHESELVVRRVVERLDLGARERGPEAGIGGALDGGHGRRSFRERRPFAGGCPKRVVPGGTQNRPSRRL
nr:hypothetical protein [Rubricoccus marinus]